MQDKPEQELRSVNVYRVKTDDPKALPPHRLFQPYEGAPAATIKELESSLDGVYDLVLLHDPHGCLLLNLQPDADKKLIKLPCKIKH